MPHTVSADGNCTEQKPPKDPYTAFSTLGKTVMEDYPLCKKTGLNLFVDKDQPKVKLDTHVLTHGIIHEVANFAKIMCGTKKKIINDILEHNFNINMQGREVFPSQILQSLKADDNEEAWLNEVFVIPPWSHRQHEHASKLDDAFAMQRNEMKETVNKRKLALQTKKERATLPSHKISVVKKPRGNPWNLTSPYPTCMEIGLDLDVTSKPGKEKKVDMKLLTKAVMLEIYKFAVKKTHHYLPQSLYDILDYNFDLRSQHHRRWEFTMATAFEVQRLVKQYRRKQDGADEVFELPFVFAPKSSSKPKKRGSFGREEKTQTPGNVQNKCDMEQEETGTEITYTIPLEESDLDSDIGDDCGMEQEESRTENSFTCPQGETDLDPDETHYVGNCTPFLTPTVVPSTLPAVNSNVNQPFVCLPDKRGLCEGEEQTQTPRNVPTKCDMEQEDIGAESLWKLRANRVKQILSEFGPFYWSKKVGLEFNVGFGPKQHISVDSLHNSLLIEVAKFALAVNSSQQYFIMEILEYNFDFYFQSESQRNTVTCEIMERVRQLKDSQDADKGPGEVFDLPHSITARDQEVQSVSSINPELRSVCRTEECDVAPICHLHLHAETKEHMSLTILDAYPFCKEIGLMLHVNQHQQNKKLDIKKLTNGAMTEVANFAEKLCGTFEQICLDILRHNLDLDLQSGESDRAQSVLARIPSAVERMNLSTCAKVYKQIKYRRKGCLRKAKLDCHNSPNVDACSAGSSQAATRDKNVGSSPEPENQKELNSMLWNLRANHIQEILSIPHGEHCPLYCYSRCKKLGIDFNVGSGVKQNLDPKLLTNGIMVEICTFAIALLSAKKYFITEILEYNFHLHFHNELHRSAFAQQTKDKIRVMSAYKTPFQMKTPFKLPDMRFIQEPSYEKAAYCPKCYQEREHKLRQEETGHMHYPRPHTVTNEVSADVNCKAQQPAKSPSSTFAAIKDKIMDCYPQCKKIGLSLCVNKDQPKVKLDMCVLTLGIMVEVAKFAKELCSTKSDIINSVLEHNFNVGMQRQEIDTVDLFRRVMAQKDVGLAWFSGVFVSQPCFNRKPGHASELDEASAIQISKRKETINKRKLALQTKEEGPTLPSHNTRVKISKTDHQIKVPVNCYPICTEIGLDLDVTSKSRSKKKMDLKLLTGAVVLEIHKFASKKNGHYLPHTVYDILDYNFDLSSQHHRRWEFSIATSSKVQTMVKNYHKYGYGADKVFELPFVCAPKKRPNKKPKKYSQENPNKKTHDGRFVRQVRYHLVSNCVHFLDGFKNNEEPWSYDEDTEFSTDPGTMVQMNGSLVSVGCDSPLQENIQKKEEEYDPHYGNMNPELDTGMIVPMSGSLQSEACGSPLQENIQIKEEEYNPHYGNMKQELDTDMIVPMSGSLESEACGSPLQENIKIKEEYNPHYGNMKQEPDTEEKYHPQYGDVKTESNTESVEHTEPTEPPGYTSVILCPNSEKPPTELENQYVQYYILAETQGSAVCPNVKTELDTECVQYLVPVEAAESQEYTIVIIGQGNESAVIKEEQEDVPADSHHC